MTLGKVGAMERTHLAYTTRNIEVSTALPSPFSLKGDRMETKTLLSGHFWLEKKLCSAELEACINLMFFPAIENVSVCFRLYTIRVLLCLSTLDSRAVAAGDLLLNS